jgi:hypothetical protein
MAEDLANQDLAPDIDQTFSVPDDVKGRVSISDAARLLARQRHAAAPAPVSQAESAPAEAAPPEQPSADETDAAPPQEATGEDQEADQAPQEPPLELPRSWTRDQAEHWNRLDRSTQEFLLESDRKASDAVRRSQNEAAEQKKTLDGERQRLEQARAQYESALPALVESLQQSIAGDFPDIKNWEDVQKLAREDWARYIAWDASQKKLATIANEAQAAQQRQAQDLQARFVAFAKEQDARFIERNPEFADQAKAAALQKAAINTLKNTGFSEDELGRQWAGQEALSLRDARLQEIIKKASLYDQAQASIKKAAPKALPPVQRPGVAPAPGRGVQQQISALEKQLDRTTSHAQGAKLAAELLRLRRSQQ